jgi:hypothetical protein
VIEFYGVTDVYSESGVDLTQLRDNLRRSFAERWRRHTAFAKLANAFRAVHLKGAGNDVSTRPFEPSGILQAFADHQVEYVVIGGLAMIARASAHVTVDLDVCYQRTTDNIAALVRALTPFAPSLRGAPSGLPFRFDEATVQAGLNFTLITTVCDVDLLGEVAGIGGYEQVLAQSTREQLFGLGVNVLTLEGLIAAKKAAGRRKDLGHLLELEELKKMRDAQEPP